MKELLLKDIETLERELQSINNKILLNDRRGKTLRKAKGNILSHLDDFRKKVLTLTKG